MTSSRLLAAASATIALTMLVVYLLLIAHQGNEPAIWFLAALGVAILLAAYGATGPHRTALIAAGALLIALGLVGILSIGLPILVAGVLAMVAAARRATSLRR